MASSARYTTTKEERVEMVVGSKNNNGFGDTDKLTKYLGQDNVKCYNRTLVDKSLKQNKRKTFQNEDECFNEVSDYFKLCDTYNMIPTIASLCVYLGVSRETLYYLSKQSFAYSDTLQNAIDICHSFLETGSLSNSINSVLYIFLGKNYYNMQDNSTINLSANNNQTISNTQTMDAIRQQIALEQSQK